MTRRFWTSEDQLIAEAMHALGCSLNDIGQALGRSAFCVRYNLFPEIAKRNREHIRQLQAANPEKFRERRRQYKINNCDQIREQRRQYRINNSEQIRDYIRRRKALIRSSRKASLTSLTAKQTHQRFAAWRNLCAYCGVKAKHPRNASHDRLTVDHVLALARHGLDELSNIVPACFTCNSSKNDSPVETWYRRQPFFAEARWRKICRHCPASIAGQLPLAFSPADAEAA